MQPRRRPTLLDGLTLTETSVCAKGANRHAEILFWKRDGTPLPPPLPAPLAARLAKLEADLTSLRADRRVDEVHEALAKRDTARAGELLGDADTCHAFYARAAGEEGGPPVAKAAGPDRRAEIRKAVAADDHAELERLVNLDGRREYYALLTAGELDAAGEQGIAKRARVPADVPEAEVSRWRERIRGMLWRKDQKAMEAARREAGAGFEAAWIAMWVAGERMTM